MHAPAWLYDPNRSEKDKKEFNQITYNDIDATIKFLYKRGMWSKYHYMEWTKALNAIKDDGEALHLWWDAIVSGAMFETETGLGERIEALKEFESDEVEQKKMCKRQKRNLKPKG